MARTFRFTKYHGCGNDFILKDELSGRRTPDSVRSRLAESLTDRNFGIGADGILFVERAAGADGAMRLFEPAGNEADMCGNGLRCVAAFLMDALGKSEVDVMTKDGLKRVKRVGSEYRVDMGPVRTLRKDLRGYVTDKGRPSDSMLDFPLVLDGRRLKASVLNTGEPHIVVQTKALDKVDMVRMGELVNRDRRRFPRNININFMQVSGPKQVKVRTYERGVFDETLACGTGATACASAAILLSLVRPGPVGVHTRGGKLTIELDAQHRAFMTGPAVPVYEGELTADLS